MKPSIVLIYFLLLSIFSFCQVDSTKAIQQNEGKTFTVVEQMPSFPGGEEKLLLYISENFKYPHSAKQDNIHGKVYVSFVVNKLGVVEDVKIKRGIRNDIDEAAKEVISKMPKWKPGLQNDKPVNVEFNLPVRF